MNIPTISQCNPIYRRCSKCIKINETDSCHTAIWKFHNFPVPNRARGAKKKPSPSPKTPPPKTWQGWKFRFMALFWAMQRNYGIRSNYLCTQILRNRKLRWEPPRPSLLARYPKPSCQRQANVHYPSMDIEFRLIWPSNVGIINKVQRASLGGTVTGPEHTRDSLT